MFMDMVPQSRSKGEANEETVRFHNPWLEPRGEPLARLSDEIFAETEAAARRLSRRKPRSDATERRRLAVGNIVASLAEIALLPGIESALAIDARKGAKTRYDRHDFHRDVFMGAIASLEQVGLLDVTPGEFRVFRTRLRPTLGFLNRLRAQGVTPSDIGVKPGGEPIVLKAKIGERGRKELVDYTDTSDTARLRQEVELITETLNRADVRLDGVAMPPVFIQRIFQIDGLQAPHEFNRHGRLWGGFWQSLPKADRGLIAIDNEPICDLDFKACFLNLAYVRMGAPLPVGDPYEIEGLDASYRSALKKVCSALLFRDGTRRARLPEQIRKELPTGWTMPKLIEALTVKHPAIAPLFGSGVGLEIMHTESQILVAALLDLAQQGVPALGMHDGLAVRRSQRDLAISAMRSASMVITGVKLPIVEKPVSRDHH